MALIIVRLILYILNFKGFFVKLKIFINYIAFILLVVFITFAISNFIHNGSNYYETNLLKTIYNMKPNSIDVLVIGPSTSESGWNPLVAWNNYGITSLNYSFSLLPAPVIKNIIIDVLKKQKPEVILINVDSFTNHVKKDKGRKFFFYYIYRFIPMSFNKLDILKKMTTFYNLDFKTFIYSILPITAMHEKVFADDIKPTGLCLAYIRNHYFQQNNSSANIRLDLLKQHFQDNILPSQDIGDLFEFISNLEIPVLFVDVPQPLFFTKPFYTKGLIEEYNSFFKLLREKNIDYINTNQYYTIRDLNFYYPDSFDGDHLNYSGAKKYTDYVSKILVDRYHLEDKRNDPNYSFWNDAAKQYIKDVKDNFDVDISL